MLLGPLLAKWIAIAISFVLLLILVKLGVSILSHALTGAVESVKPLAVINQLLGGVLGLAKTGAPDLRSARDLFLAPLAGRA